MQYIKTPMANILWILPGEEKKLWYIRDQGMQYTKVCVCQCLRKGPSRFNQQGQLWPWKLLNMRVRWV